MRQLVAWAAVAVLATAGFARAQPPAPKPGPEHERLKELEGTWEANVEMPGMPASKGTMVYKMDLGGLWLTSNYTGDFGGQAFTGRGLDTYDPASKQYIGIWADSMVTSPMI